MLVVYVRVKATGSSGRSCPHYQHRWFLAERNGYNMVGIIKAHAGLLSLRCLLKLFPPSPHLSEFLSLKFCVCIKLSFSLFFCFILSCPCSPYFSFSPYLFKSGIIHIFFLSLFFASLSYEHSRKVDIDTTSPPLYPLLSLVTMFFPRRLARGQSLRRDWGSRANERYFR